MSENANYTKASKSKECRISIHRAAIPTALLVMWLLNGLFANLPSSSARVFLVNSQIRFDSSSGITGGQPDFVARNKKFDQNYEAPSRNLRSVCEFSGPKQAFGPFANVSL